MADWISAVPLSWGAAQAPVRPVTLRRHLSVGLPLSESFLSLLPLLDGS